VDQGLIPLVQRWWVSSGRVNQRPWRTEGSSRRMVPGMPCEAHARAREPCNPRAGCSLGSHGRGPLRNVLGGWAGLLPATKIIPPLSCSLPRSRP